MSSRASASARQNRSYAKCQFANVVENGGCANGLDLLVAKFHQRGHLDGIGLNPFEVIVGTLVLRFDGGGQRLNGA